MNLKEFIRRLSLSTAKWCIRDLHKDAVCGYATYCQILRCQINECCCCPVSSLEDRPSSQYYNVAMKLGLPKHIAELIADASDYESVEMAEKCHSGHESETLTHPDNFLELRKLLLTACGLA